MTKSNKILCIIGAILIAFIGLFGIVFATQKDNIVKADSSTTYYSFQTNDFLIPISLSNSYSSYTANTIVNGFSFFNFNISFQPGATSVISYSATTSSNQSYTTAGTGALHFDPNNDWHSDYFTLFSSGAGGSYRYYAVAHHFPSDFNFNIYKIVVDNYPNGMAFSFSAFMEFKFYDTNEKAIVIQFPYKKDINANYFAWNRTIYVENLSTLSDNQYFQAGYDNGFDVGNSAGYNTGYSAGYDVGNSAGYDSGYSAGVQDANDYTFLGLIGATIDAPISAFTSFFDFELLGVNLKDFFFAVLTFALVIVIIRFALGR